MKEDNISKLGLVTSLCSNSNHLISLIPPQTASNFRHLISCGTIHNGNKKFVALLLLRNYDVINYILADA